MTSHSHSVLNTTSRSLVNAIGKVIALISLANQIARERRALSRLDDDQLHDLGISRSDAIRESERRYSDVPDNRFKHRVAPWRNSHRLKNNFHSTAKFR